MKYSKRVREEAAMICAIAASTPDLEESYGLVVDLLRVDRRAISFGLSLAAWSKVHGLGVDHPDAEAEALIRTGWSP